MGNRLQGRVALITGGAQGIGRAIAERFAAEGAKIVIIDVVEDKANATVDALKTGGGDALALICDVTDRAQVEQTVQAALDHFGRIDVLCNNAGITRDARLVKMTEEQFDAVIAVNLKGVFNLTQAVAPHMIAQGFGRVITTSSVVGLYGNFGQTNYVATKSGVIGMTKVWARELGPKGITANAVAPGFIATEMVQSVPQEILDRFVKQTPVRRLGEPEDIANAFLFLASDEASFVNGAVLSVDGGLVV